MKRVRLDGLPEFTGDASPPDFREDFAVGFPVAYILKIMRTTAASRSLTTKRPPYLILTNPGLNMVLVVTVCAARFLVAQGRALLI